MAAKTKTRSKATGGLRGLRSSASPTTSKKSSVPTVKGPDELHDKKNGGRDRPDFRYGQGLTGKSTFSDLYRVVGNFACFLREFW